MNTKQVESITQFEIKEATGIASFSVQALVGTPSPRTVRVVGQINKRRVSFLRCL